MSPTNTAAGHFLFKRAPAILGEVGRGRGSKGEMWSSALLPAISEKGQIILISKAVVLKIWDCVMGREYIYGREVWMSQNHKVVRF